MMCFQFMGRWFIMYLGTCRAYHVHVVMTDGAHHLISDPV